MSEPDYEAVKWIIETPPEVPLAEVWGPTMQLRIYRPGMAAFSDNDRLQQKWIERRTGKTEWRNVEVVTSLTATPTT